MIRQFVINFRLTRNCWFIALVFACAASYIRQAWGEGDTPIVVVVNQNSPVAQLTRDEVAMLFLGKLKRVHDVDITPLDNKNAELRERFYQAIAEMNGIRIKAYWSRIVFSGQGRPPMVVSTVEAATKLDVDLGCMAYVQANQVTPSMKIVFNVSQ